MGAAIPSHRGISRERVLAIFIQLGQEFRKPFRVTKTMHRCSIR